MIEFIVGIFVALFTAFLYGKSQGKQKDIEEKAQSMEKAKSVENEVNKMGDDKLNDVASKWVRNKNH